MKYKIVFERENCVGAAPCIKEWSKFSMGDDVKAVLEGSTEQDGNMVLEIEDGDFEQALAAAKSCPVSVISIFNLETNEKIV